MCHFSVAPIRYEKEAGLRARSARRLAGALADRPHRGRAPPASLTGTPFLQVIAQGGLAAICEMEATRQPRLAARRLAGHAEVVAVVFSLAPARARGLRGTAASGVVSLKGLQHASATTFAAKGEGRREVIGRSRILPHSVRAMTRGRVGNFSRGLRPAPAVGPV